ncbi:MAG: O-antigen ligase family protein [Henriciella sp.]|nr:O-antigen ligase family protein [Henriciella sp.]
MRGLSIVLPADRASAAEAGSQAVPGRLELALLFLALILFSGGLLPRLISGEQSADGLPLLRVLWLPVYALTLAAMVWKTKTMAITALRMPFMLALIILAGLSCLWSIDPGLSQRRGLAIAMTCFAGMFIGSRYDWKTLLRMFGMVWLTVSVLSFLTALLNPGFGVMQDVHAGAWTGLYFEKNQLGGNMARAAFLSGFLFLMDRPWRKLWAFGAVLCAVMVLLTTSMTSLLGLLLGIAVLSIGAWMKRGLLTGLVITWAGVVVAGIFAVVMIFAPDLIFAALGRDPSLTGRTDIWAALVDMIGQRPWFGYGYGAFWASESEPAYWVREVLGWDAPTAHNGWLEVALALGLVGLACLVLDFCMTLWRALRSSLNTWTGIFALGVCAQFILFSLSESISLQQNDLTWITYVAVAAQLTRRSRRDSHFKRVQSRQGLQPVAT